MTYKEDKHNQAKSDMLGEFNRAITDAEDLRKAALQPADDAAAAAREISGGKAAGAGTGPADATQAPAGTSGHAADAAGDRAG
jgi:hypothetical protein